MSQYFGVKETVTPAYSPWFNSVNERNHATIDRMVNMMRTESTEMGMEQSLFWAVHAFNTLESSRGFTPMQLMMGINATVPTLSNSGPTLLPIVDASGCVRNNLTALHKARSALINCETDRILKEALKS